jgi:hypothetical protein
MSTPGSEHTPSRKRPAYSLVLTVLLATYLAFLGTGPIRAQIDDPPNDRWLVGAQDIRFENLTNEDGLSHNGVFAIVQDHTGFLWIGTSDGLNRYDGYEFTVLRYDPQDPASLSDNWVRALLVDRGGNLWVASRGGRSSEVAHRFSSKVLVEYWTQTAKRICVDSPASVAVKLQARAI